MSHRWLAGVVALFAAGARAQGCVVTVSLINDYGTLPISVLYRAKLTASRILTGAGVTLQWHAGPPRIDARQADCALRIEISFDRQIPAGFRPDALAFAAPFADSGTRIHVFRERIRILEHDEWTAALLAHVLAHEIGHVLEACSHHSRSGVMKARFEQRDIDEMMLRPLQFAPEDIDLIRLGIERAAARH